MTAPANAQPWQETLAAHRRGDFTSAAAQCQERLRANPGDADALHLLGVMAQQQGDARSAAELIGRAIEIDSHRPAFHNNLGEVYRTTGRAAEARECYERALAVDPRMAAAHFHLGLLLRDGGETAAAIDHLHAASAVEPANVEALVTCGDLEFHLGRYHAALATYGRAIAVRADAAALWWRRGLCHHRLRQAEPALADYQQALAIDPHEVDAHNHLAGLYLDLGRPDPAIEHVQRALEVLPQSAELHGNLALMLRAQGRLDESIAESRRAVELAPQSATLASNLLYTLNDSARYDAASVFAEHLAWAARHAESLTAASSPPGNDRDPDRRLRIGYVSPYFRQHAVNYFSEPILANHDHRAFEIYCYSDTAAPDRVTEKLRSYAEGWREIVGRSDEDVARIVREDRIDVLIDLTGHIAGHRLLAFARRAAPVQVTYLGYQNTTGMSAMDYRLTDEWADPPGSTERYYTERLVRLPRAFFCYQPSDEARPPGPLPAGATGQVTFGSFNNFNKVTPEALAAWLTILQRVEGSRLLVLAFRGGWVEEQLRGMARQRGIDATRIELFDKCPAREYYELLARADIALDPFPFNGHTTTCDAVWMGVPVVMLAGDRYASRFGGSVLRNVGLGDLVTSSVEAYIERAVLLAHDRARLAELRTALGERMRRSPLCDYVGFTRNLEAAYRAMWHTWCSAADHTH